MKILNIIYKPNILFNENKEKLFDDIVKKIDINRLKIELVDVYGFLTDVLYDLYDENKNDFQYSESVIQQKIDNIIDKFIDDIISTITKDFINYKNKSLLWNKAIETINERIFRNISTNVDCVTCSSNRSTTLQGILNEAFIFYFSNLISILNYKTLNNVNINQYLRFYIPDYDILDKEFKIIVDIYEFEPVNNNAQPTSATEIEFEQSTTEIKQEILPEQTAKEIFSSLFEIIKTYTCDVIYNEINNILTEENLANIINDLITNEKTFIDIIELNPQLFEYYLNFNFLEIE